MSRFTIVKAAEIVSGELTSVGQRKGADSGDPQMKVKVLAPEAEGSLAVWECQPGGWPVINRPDTEFAYILSGHARLTDNSTGEAIDVTGGDLVILPQGWTGRWDILETIRKVYAIY